ncbi:MSCRAMM family adhesin SdrC [Brachybacterium huguangmaarense]|uniref:MSCRAMM family adhesin SdrC n=1 Tax=Brachybacterium huguangmaarense TaxID=1652028 RepID=A0ABY6G0C7_9MICO|nr:MSCRAMM family adhesin SdrC [Brachybacterium huguangmaarense]UYG16562.1 MSCRAMM family adhesin SdrC [Brachybacterium huguangmaarense]
MARHLVAAGALVEDDPETAVAHARFAARRGGRVGVVRETYGITAYRAGDYATALKELRTAVRITGRYDLLPMIADCERGLGRPEKALDLAASPEAEKLDAVPTIEMMIVVAGAYADTGDISTALASLEMPALRQKVNGAWQVHLWVAYADLLEQAGRSEEAHRWLTLAADTDTELLTDAAERLGRPAPVQEDPSWEDDEQVTVIDAFVDLEDADEHSEPDADEDLDGEDVDGQDADGEDEQPVDEEPHERAPEVEHENPESESEPADVSDPESSDEPEHAAPEAEDAAPEAEGPQDGTSDGDEPDAAAEPDTTTEPEPSAARADDTVADEPTDEPAADDPSHEVDEPAEETATDEPAEEERA